MKNAKTKKKAVKLPEGISMKRTSKGINVTISENGRVIAVLRGYNNSANMQKGLSALDSALIKAMRADGKYNVIDLTPKPKKVAKKRP